MSIMCEFRKEHSNLLKCVNILLYHSCKCINLIKNIAPPPPKKKKKKQKKSH